MNSEPNKQEAIEQLTKRLNQLEFPVMDGPNSAFDLTENAKKRTEENPIWNSNSGDLQKYYRLFSERSITESEFLAFLQRKDKQIVQNENLSRRFVASGHFNSSSQSGNQDEKYPMISYYVIYDGNGHKINVISHNGLDEKNVLLMKNIDLDDFSKFLSRFSSDIESLKTCCNTKDAQAGFKKILRKEEAGYEVEKEKTTEYMKKFGRSLDSFDLVENDMDRGQSKIASLKHFREFGAELTYDVGDDNSEPEETPDITTKIHRVKDKDSGVKGILVTNFEKIGQIKDSIKESEKA